MKNYDIIAELIANKEGLMRKKWLMGHHIDKTHGFIAVNIKIPRGERSNPDDSLDTRGLYYIYRHNLSDLYDEAPNLNAAIRKIEAFKFVEDEGKKPKGWE